VIELMAGGNLYEVYALGLTTASLRVILREVFRHPSQAGRISFPRQIQETRAYLRERDLLRRQDESDFYVDDYEDVDEETPVKAVEEDDAEDTAESEDQGEGEVDEVEIDASLDEEEDSSL
jgi:hypothetical protein